jgi:hypothetical protein
MFRISTLIALLMAFVLVNGVSFQAVATTPDPILKSGQETSQAGSSQAGRSQIDSSQVDGTARIRLAAPKLDPKATYKRPHLVYCPANRCISHQARRCYRHGDRCICQRRERASCPRTGAQSAALAGMTFQLYATTRHELSDKFAICKCFDAFHTKTSLGKRIEWRAEVASSAWNKRVHGSMVGRRCARMRHCPKNRRPSWSSRPSARVVTPRNVDSCWSRKEHGKLSGSGELHNW